MVEVATSDVLERAAKGEPLTAIEKYALGQALLEVSTSDEPTLTAGVKERAAKAGHQFLNAAAVAAADDSSLTERQKLAFGKHAFLDLYEKRAQMDEREYWRSLAVVIVGPLRAGLKTHLREGREARSDAEYAKLANLFLKGRGKPRIALEKAKYLLEGKWAEGAGDASDEVTLENNQHLALVWACDAARRKQFSEQEEAGILRLFLAAMPYEKAGRLTKAIVER